MFMIVWWAIIIALIWVIVYYFNNSNILSTTDKVSVGTEKKVVSTEWEKTIKEQSNEILLNEEIKTKISYLNRVLKPNYLKITDFKQKDSIWNYAPKGGKFYQFTIDYDISPESMADFDVLIEKGSTSVEDFNSKSDLYKKQTEERMKNFYQVYWYDRLKHIWIIGYVKNIVDNEYGLYQMGDYIYERYYDSWLWANTLSSLSVLKDYFNYEPIFFNKEPKDILKIVKSFQKELKSEDFDKLVPLLERIYFYDVNEEKKDNNTNK